MRSGAWPRRLGPRLHIEACAPSSLEFFLAMRDPSRILPLRQRVQMLDPNSYCCQANLSRSTSNMVQEELVIVRSMYLTSAMQVLMQANAGRRHFHVPAPEISESSRKYASVRDLCMVGVF